MEGLLCRRWPAAKGVPVTEPAPSLERAAASQMFGEEASTAPPT